MNIYKERHHPIGDQLLPLCEQQESEAAIELGEELRDVRASEAPGCYEEDSDG